MKPFGFFSNNPYKNLETYWSDTDGSYIEVSSESEATKVNWPWGDHSAITTEVPGIFESKLGYGPVVRCNYNVIAYIYYNHPEVFKYYAKASCPVKKFSTTFFRR